MKSLIYIFFLALFLNTYAQKQQKSEFGSPSHNELSVNTYDNFPNAEGVVIFEKGLTSMKYLNGGTKLVKEVYVKMKVLDAKKFERSTITLYTYGNKRNSEIIKEFNAITHNGTLKNYVSEDKLYSKDETPNWKAHSFTFPNVKDGSVLEYKYTIISPFLTNFGGWNFQGSLPTLYSEFQSKIPGNYIYNRELYGTHRLAVNDAKEIPHCFDVPGFATSGDCELSTYVMTNLPALKDEKYVFSPKSQIASIRYAYVEFINADGARTPYARDWDDVDGKLKFDSEFGKELKNARFLQRKLPENLLSITGEEERAKAVYYHIQKNYNWNQYYNIFSNEGLKKAVESKSGNSAEINFILANALEAAKIDADVMLIPLREKGMPTKRFPVISEFDLPIVIAKVKDKKVALDATNKWTPYGMLPFRDLNVEGRVMDFDDESYWMPIEPNKRNVHYVNSALHFTPEGTLEGDVKEINLGYMGISERTHIYNNSAEDFKKLKEKQFKTGELFELAVKNKDSLDAPLEETYKVSFETDNVGDKIYINPIFIETIFSENPFKSSQRNFPIDLGYPITETILISLNIGDQYAVEELPQNKVSKLPNNDGEVSIAYSHSGTNINVRYNLVLNSFRYPKEAYKALQDFFALAVTMQNENIVLKEI